MGFATRPLCDAGSCRKFCDNTILSPLFVPQQREILRLVATHIDQWCLRFGHGSHSMCMFKTICSLPSPPWRRLHFMHVAKQDSSATADAPRNMETMASVQTSTEEQRNAMSYVFSSFCRFDENIKMKKNFVRTTKRSIH